MKTLDRSRDFGVVSGQAAHKYEQDGLRFDAQGVCIDEPGYKGAKATPARDTRTTPQADPQIIEQIAKQTAPGSIVVGAQAPDVGSGQTTELETLGLTAKVMASLRGAEVTTVEALTRCTADQLVALPNIGETTVKAIKKALKNAGKKLAG